MELHTVYTVRKVVYNVNSASQLSSIQSSLSLQCTCTFKSKQAPRGYVKRRPPIVKVAEHQCLCQCSKQAFTFTKASRSRSWWQQTEQSRLIVQQWALPSSVHVRYIE